MRSLTLTSLLVLIASVLLVSAAPASAARPHEFKGVTIGEPGSGPGQLSEPSGVAVNEATGDVYVVDTKDNRVESFSSTGTFLHQFNGQEIDGLPGGLGKEAPAKFSFPSAIAETSGIAIDNACQLHKPVLTEATSPTCAEYDPSAGDVYVADVGHSVVDKFTAAGEFVGQVDTASPLNGIAVSDNGELWTCTGDEVATVVNFPHAPTTDFTESESRNTPGFGYAEPGFAADANDNLYVHINGLFAGTNLIYKFTRAGDELSGHHGNQFDTEPPTGVAVELSNSDLYEDNGESLSRIGPELSKLERLTVPGGGGGGVGVDSASETVFVATTADTVQVGEVVPPGKPSAGGISTSQVTGDSAVLSGEVKPNGAASTYSFEYGSCPPDTTSCPGTPFTDILPSPEGSVGAENDFNTYPVSVHVQALKPGTVYHYRLHAHSPLGEGNAEGTFRTQNPPGSFALLDSRTYEMVSPSDKHGAGLKFIGHGQVTQAAAAGGAFTYLADAPTEAQPAGYAVLVQVLSKRGPDGWESHDLALPHGSATGSTGSEYVAFDEGLSSAIVQPIGAFEPSLTAEAPQRATEQTPYLADLAASHTLYTPLVTAANDPFHPFGEEGSCPPQSLCGPGFAGATPDLKHVVLQSHVALTETPLVKSNDEIGEYEWSEGKLSLLTALPDGQAAGNGPSLGSDEGALARNAISADGSRVVWSEHGGDNHLYLRYNATQQQSPIVNGKCSVPSDACTLQLDAVQEGASGENAAEPEFQVASVDGSRVFFTDPQRLTTDSGGQRLNSGEGDLYVCQIVVGAGGEQACDLTDVTPRHNGENAGVQDVMPGISDKGCDVGSSGECNAYFVADGILTEEPNAAGEHAVRGNCSLEQAAALCNLYVAHWDGSGWTTRLVAVLSAEDYPDWNGQHSLIPFQEFTSRVSPNGRYLEFQSDRDLTGYDPLDASTGKPDEEVYEFDAQTGRISCASCDPTGARPVGIEFGKMHEGLDGAGEVWSPASRGLAGSVPAWTTFTHGGETMYQSRYLSDSGRLFFNSPGALVSSDVNGKGDVYEYEPKGVGNCSEATNGPSIAYKPARTFEGEVEGQNLKGEEGAGCVGLVSSGTSSEESGFLDASEGGSEGEHGQPGTEAGADVFFLTTEKLSRADYDTSYDVYDAHECSSASPCITPPGAQPASCESADACRAAPTPQPEVFGAPASATFSGPGNLTPPTPVSPAKPKTLTKAQLLAKALKACRKKHNPHKRLACQKQAHKRYPSKSSKGRK